MLRHGRAAPSPLLLLFVGALGVLTLVRPADASRRAQGDDGAVIGRGVVARLATSGAAAGEAPAAPLRRHYRRRQLFVKFARFWLACLSAAPRAGGELADLHRRGVERAAEVNAKLTPGALDTDGDGVVDRVELLDGLCAQLKERVCGPTSLFYFESAWENLDANEDGVLSGAELVGLSAALSGSVTSFALLQSMSEVFDILPAEQSHVEAVAALACGVLAVIPEDAEHSDFVAAGIDVLRENPEVGMLNYRILSWLPSLFEVGDENKDGILSLDERIKVRVGVKLWWKGGFWEEDWRDLDDPSAEDDWPHPAHALGVGDGHFVVPQDEEAEDDFDEDEGAVEGTLRELDTNGDGAIDVQEYMTAAEDTDPSLRTMERAAMLFVRADRDNDGRLGREELADLLAAAYSEGSETVGS